MHSGDICNPPPLPIRTHKHGKEMSPFPSHATFISCVRRYSGARPLPEALLSIIFVSSEAPRLFGSEDQRYCWPSSISGQITRREVQKGSGGRETYGAGTEMFLGGGERSFQLDGS